MSIESSCTRESRSRNAFSSVARLSGRSSLVSSASMTETSSRSRPWSPIEISIARRTTDATGSMPMPTNTSSSPMRVSAASNSSGLCEWKYSSTIGSRSARCCTRTSAERRRSSSASRSACR
eukprot:Amastigsp_a178581_40.p3 type:complete len:122 gc:universal Amastigsp_a178581_40:533-168(-)